MASKPRHQMGKQFVPFSGLSSVPSDAVCKNGSLAVSMNLLHEDGELHPVGSLRKLTEGLSWRDDQNVAHPLQALFVHATFRYRHLVLTDGDRLFWLDEERLSASSGGDDAVPFFTLPSGGVGHFEAMGNVLVAFLPDGGMHYFLWQGDAAIYRSLGNHLPECVLSFGLVGRMERSDPRDILFEEAESTSTLEAGDKLKEVNQQAVTDQVLAMVNPFIAERGAKAGRFIFPFFVRYAYRLFDGTLTMHSSPVLMLPSTRCAPRVVCGVVLSDSTVSQVRAAVCGMTHQLDYRCMAPSAAVLNDWKDVVQSVDIFISAPLYSYKQSGKVERILAGDGESLTDDWMVSDAERDGQPEGCYRLRSFLSEYLAAFPDDGNPAAVVLPSYTEDEMSEALRQCGQFYLLTSIPLDQLSEERVALPVSEGYLSSLQVRELMSDDYESHMLLLPSISHIYNRRLHVAGLRQRLFEGCQPLAAVCYCDPVEHADYGLLHSADHPLRVFVFLKCDASTVVVESPSSSLSFLCLPSYYFFPDPSAYRVVMTDGERSVVFPLRRHAMLHGAYHYAEWTGHVRLLPPPSSLPDSSSAGALLLSYPHQLRVSEVSNPFLFPVEGVHSVGSGRVVGMRSAARAMSEGQFGVYPLYVFTDEGVWALSVASDGGYATAHPVSSLHAEDGSPLLSVSDGVVYVSVRGLMLVRGSEVSCLSDVLSGGFPAVDGFPGLLSFVDALQPQADLLGVVSETTFRDVLSDCRLVYDAVRSRVWVMGASSRAAWVLSLRSLSWGMALLPSGGELRALLPSGPSVWLSFADGSLYAMDAMGSSLLQTDVAETDVPVLMVTRPLKGGIAHGAWRVSRVALRGYLSRGQGELSLLLYGSDDLRHWLLLRGSGNAVIDQVCGSPCRYYRLVATSAALSPLSAISCMEIE